LRFLSAWSLQAFSECLVSSSFEKYEATEMVFGRARRARGREQATLIAMAFTIDCQDDLVP